MVQFPLPIGMRGNEKESELISTNRDLEFWCEGTNIPGIGLATHPVLRYGYGAVEKKPASPSFNDVNFSIIGDGKADNWTFFKSWISMINNFDLRNGINPDTVNTKIAGKSQSPYELAYKYEYASDVNILVFDDTGKSTFDIILRDAYPIFLGDIQLNWSDNNTIMKIPVSFTFQDWYSQK